jgi:hypothetical protein
MPPTERVAIPIMLRTSRGQPEVGPTTSDEALAHPVLRLVDITSRQQQTQRTLLAWLRVEYGIEKPSNKLLALTDLDSDTWVSEVKRIRGKKQPLSSAGLHALRDEYTRTLAPARALAAEILTLERRLSAECRVPGRVP